MELHSIVCLQVKSLRFHYTMEGNFYSEGQLLLPKHCNSKSFDLTSGEYRVERGSRSCIDVRRDYGNVAKDPYNEDGRPPTVMLSIIDPIVEIFCNQIIVSGLEVPNMCWAGFLREPYQGCPRGRMDYLDGEILNKLRYRKYEQLGRQRIVMEIL